MQARESVAELVGNEQVKTKEAASLGYRGEAGAVLEFIETKAFFQMLESWQVRENAEPHDNLVEFLSLEHSSAANDLLLKKIVRMVHECKTNEYFKSVGERKRKRPLRKIRTMDDNNK